MLKKSSLLENPSKKGEKSNFITRIPAHSLMGGENVPSRRRSERGVRGREKGKTRRISSCLKGGGEGLPVDKGDWPRKQRSPPRLRQKE